MPLHAHGANPEGGIAKALRGRVSPLDRLERRGKNGSVRPLGTHGRHARAAPQNGNGGVDEFLAASAPSSRRRQRSSSPMRALPPEHAGHPGVTAWWDVRFLSTSVWVAVPGLVSTHSPRTGYPLRT